MASDAVRLDAISRVTGYKIRKGANQNNSPYLPQRIAIFAEANEAQQGTLDLTPFEATTLKQIGERYGYGSPIYTIMRILRPNSGGGVGCQTVVYPQAKAIGATQKQISITPSGVATANGTHTVRISGREILDGASFDVNIVTGDNTAAIADKIADAINAVVGAQVIAAADDYNVDLTTKWAGLTANEVNVEINLNGASLGISYNITTDSAGAGTPSVQPALDLFKDNWNTIVINSYGIVTSVLNALEAFNGHADSENPTGRYDPIIMKPFVAITGSISPDPSASTDTRKTEMTIAIAPAPNSKALSMEAAANMAVLFANVETNSPHLDVGGKYYPDMPVPIGENIGTMGDYNSRDAIVKKGCSTVLLSAGQYQVQDFVTTYHPIGELPPSFRYVRDIFLDLNIYFDYRIATLASLMDKMIANDNDLVKVNGTIKPKDWKGVVDTKADYWVALGFIVEASFTKASIVVGINTTNPNRIDTFFRYKRSGVGRISSTDAEANFNFGTL